MPSYYYAAAGGALLLLVLLLVRRAQKAKAAKDDAGSVAPVADAEVTESKRAAKSRARAEAKASKAAESTAKADARAAAKAGKSRKAAKSSKVAKSSGEPAQPKVRGRRAKRQEAPEETSRTLEVPVLAPAPAYVQQDGWLTTADAVADIAPAAPSATPAAPDLYEPLGPSYSVPQQLTPDDGDSAFAMAGAPATLAPPAPPQDAIAAQAVAQPVAATFSVPAAMPAAAQTSFSELASAAAEAPTAPAPVEPDVPLGPYTFGARTILPGKR
ncbi:MAG: hypothetical protein QOI42_527 [Frankiaceae bacterium]|jgi:hypothetical protein|nr:hypothetical protein [Frankiaceae bacterium]